MSNRSDIEWSPRVSLAKIRALYINEASGSIEDDLVEEVGFGLLARCRSILEYTEAMEGRVQCKRCARNGVETILMRQSKSPSEALRCSVCGWQIKWRVYVTESEKLDGQLTAGHAGDAFRRYVARYPQCTTREEKITAIDRLIHEFHWIALNEHKEATPHKPAGVNLLRGSSTQVIELLNELTYGEHTPPELLEGKAWWEEKKQQSKLADRF